MKLPKIPHWPLLLGPWIAFGLGFLSNAVVIAVNGGQMPVQWMGACTAQTMQGDLVHTCMTSATHLKILADWVLINGSGIASPGDFLLWTWQLTWLPALCTWVYSMIVDSEKVSVK